MTDVADAVVGEGQILADQLGAGKVPALPARSGEQAADDAAALDYILNQSKCLSDALLGKDKATAAAFELGIRSQVLLLIFIPGDIQEEESLVLASLMGMTDRGMAAGLDQEFLTAELRKVGNAPSHELMKTELDAFLRAAFTKLQ